MIVYGIGSLPPLLVLGRQTETGVERVGFDCAEWLNEWPDMTLSLWVKRSGDVGAYPVATEMSGTTVVWTVDGADTAIPGKGCAEIIGSAEGLKKVSETVCTYVNPICSGNATEPPEAAQPWVDRVLDAAKRAEEAAEKAESGGSGSGGTTGNDGFSPVISVEAIDGGHRVSVTDAEGTKTFDVLDGAAPVRGTDYWTETDRADIVADVLAALPVWSGGVY